MVAGWEIVKAGNPRTQHDLYYWENLANGATSEIDYVVSHDMKVLPIEVKAGVSGKMKSLRFFMQKKRLTRAVRASLENFGEIRLADGDDAARIEICPLYALGNAVR